jgi:hypothetical protein
VTYYLLVFSRRRGELVREIEEFTDQRVAMTERLRLEIENKQNPDLEIVVLGAESRTAMENTHSRYFGLLNLDRI